MFDRLIQRTVEKTVRETIDRQVDAAVDRIVRNHPRFQFVKTMQLQMLGCDPQMNSRKAWNAAVEALNCFLADEDCEFGDPRFDWTRSGAVDLIHAYEIHHWEAAHD
jgi:hypothetical protein